MFFIVTFVSGERAVVHARSFSEAEDKARTLAGSQIGVRPHGSYVDSVVRLSVESALWLREGAHFPIRVPTSEIES